MPWLPDAEKISKIYLFVLTEFTNVTDTQTDGQTPHDDVSRACIASRGKNETRVILIILYSCKSIAMKFSTWYPSYPDGGAVAYVTNNKRLRSTFCTIEANYWQTRSIARPLCDSRAICFVCVEPFTTRPIFIKFISKRCVHKFAYRRTNRRTNGQLENIIMPRAHLASERHEMLLTKNEVCRTEMRRTACCIWKQFL